MKTATDKEIFRFIPLEGFKTLDDSPVHVIAEGDVQSFSEANFGRKFTDDEIKEIQHAIWDDEHVKDLMNHAISRAIDIAIRGLE